MALQEVGVEAVVRGLSAFQGDMRKMNSSLQDLRGEGTLLQRAFGGITDAVLGFGEHIIRVAEIALGVLLRDAVLAAIDFIGDLAKKIIDVSTEFQTLQIRLTGFNLDAAMEATDDYTTALGQARDMTKEQIEWIRTLGVISPFAPEAIANVYTMARAYGFADDEAKILTKNTIEFTSSMGLGNEALESVIRNLGQMKARGKITSTELRDLARSAFLPLDDVLGRVAEKMGVTTEELTKMISTPGEGVPFQNFIDAFNEMIETEPRFIGAAGRMSKALVPAIANVGELATNLGSMIVTPVFDVLGEKIASLVDEFVTFNEQGDLIKTDKWEALMDVAARVSDALIAIIQDLFGLLPSTEGLADGLVSGMGRFADWLETHKEDIVSFVDGFVTKVGELKDKIVDFIENKIIPAWDNLKNWYEENRGTIEEFFQAVGDIAKEFFSDLMGGGKDPKEEGKGFLDTLTQIMQYVIDNKDEIVKWVEILWSVFVVWQVIATVLSIVGGIFLSIAGFILGLIGTFVGLIGVINFIMPIFAAVGAIIGAISLPVIALIAAIALLAYMIITHGKEIWTTIQQLWFILKYYFEQMMLKAFEFGYKVGTFLRDKWEEIKNTVATKLSEIRDKFVDMREKVKAALNINWGEVGRSIVQGIANGISSFAGSIVTAAKNAALSAYDAAKRALGIRSPSTLFFEIGSETMQGMALGIQKAAGLAAVSMQGAMARVASAAIPSVTNSTVYNNTQNNTLNIHSSAPTEPIIQDFAMMSSLAGV